ncbi:MAG: hypothetical protein SFV15_07365 [Polyangiaceae bacterium]|nr:hypothetical protein [Polyangiaceae bacterium]
MTESLGTVNLGLDHVQVIVRGMHAVAKADGVHQVELVLLREFYEGCRQEVAGLSGFEDLIAGEFDLTHAKEVLNTPELKDTFLRSCVFLGYADGLYSAQERALVKRFATELGVVKELEEIEEQVGGELVQRVARIKNVDGLKAVVASLKDK